MTATITPSPEDSYKPIDRHYFDAPTLPLRLKPLKTVQYPDPTTTSTTVSTSRSTRSSAITSTSHSTGPPAPPLKALAWNCNGTSIATGEARTIRVWHAERPSLKHSTELKLASSGTTSGTASSNSTAGRRPLPSTAPSTVTGTEVVAWCPGKDGELASVGTDAIVRFWDVRARVLCTASVNVDRPGLSLCWRPGGVGDELVVGRRVSLSHSHHMSHSARLSFCVISGTVLHRADVS